MEMQSLSRKDSLISENVDLIQQHLKIPLEFIDSKILITGASGLIGVHLTEYFKRYANKIYVCMKHEVPIYMKEIFDNTNIIVGDITSDGILEKIPNDFDCIIHSAGYATPTKFMSNQTETTMIGLYSTGKLLRKIKKNGNFLFVSSSELYGGAKFPDENSDVIIANEKRVCYIHAKILGEQRVQKYFDEGYNAKSVRVCNAYGPGFKIGDNRALNTFIRKALLTKEIRLKDFGKDVRNYCYISDIVIKMLNILFFGKSNLYNVGSKELDSLVTISELAEKIADLTDAKVIYPEECHDIGAPGYSVVNTNKYDYEFLLCQYSSMSFEEGLKKTIDWCDYLIQYQQEYYNFTGETIKE